MFYGANGILILNFHRKKKNTHKKNIWLFPSFVIPACRSVLFGLRLFVRMFQVYFSDVYFRVLTTNQRMQLY